MRTNICTVAGCKAYAYYDQKYCTCLKHAQEKYQLDKHRYKNPKNPEEILEYDLNERGKPLYPYVMLADNVPPNEYEKRKLAFEKARSKQQAHSRPQPGKTTMKHICPVVGCKTSAYYDQKGCLCKKHGLEKHQVDKYHYKNPKNPDEILEYELKENGKAQYPYDMFAVNVPPEEYEERKNAFEKTRNKQAASSRQHHANHKKNEKHRCSLNPKCQNTSMYNIEGIGCNECVMKIHGKKNSLGKDVSLKEPGTGTIHDISKRDGTAFKPFEPYVHNGNEYIVIPDSPEWQNKERSYMIKSRRCCEEGCTNAAFRGIHGLRCRFCPLDHFRIGYDEEFGIVALKHPNLEGIFEVIDRNPLDLPLDFYIPTNIDKGSQRWQYFEKTVNKLKENDRRGRGKNKRNRIGEEDQENLDEELKAATEKTELFLKENYEDGDLIYIAKAQEEPNGEIKFDEQHGFVNKPYRDVPILEMTSNGKGIITRAGREGSLVKSVCSVVARGNESMSFYIEERLHAEFKDKKGAVWNGNGKGGVQGIDGFQHVAVVVILKNIIPLISRNLLAFNMGMNNRLRNKILEWYPNYRGHNYWIQLDEEVHTYNKKTVLMIMKNRTKLTYGDKLANGNLEGHNIVFSGVFRFTRTQMARLARFNGARVCVHISNITTLLISSNPQSKKTQEAQESNVITWTEDKFFDEIERKEIPGIVSLNESVDQIEDSKMPAMKRPPKVSLQTLDKWVKKAKK